MPGNEGLHPIKSGIDGGRCSRDVVEVGPGVEGFSGGDQVFAMANDTYAELCGVKAAILAKVPEGLDLIQAAALPLVTTTGNQQFLQQESKRARQCLSQVRGGKCRAFGMSPRSRAERS